MAHLRYDSARLSKTRRTPQGYLRADAALTRAGVFRYRQADGSVRRELRHPDDVLRADSLPDVGLPVTVGHPGLLTPANTKRHRVGGATARARTDGSLIVSELQIEDEAAIAGVEAGSLVELSCGYTCDTIEEPGVWEGERYDARQTNVVYNHVALLPRGGGRAGAACALRLDSGDAVLADGESSELQSESADKVPPQESSMKPKIKLDGVEVEVEPSVAARIEADSKRIGELEAKLGKAEGELKTAQTKLDAANDPKALDARVEARAAVVAGAQALLGADYSAAGKSDHQVRCDALKSTFEGQSEDYVRGMFAAAVDGLKAGGRHPSLERVAKSATAREDSARDDSKDEDPNAVYAASIRAKAQAWKKGAK